MVVGFYLGFYSLLLLTVGFLVLLGFVVFEFFVLVYCFLGLILSFVYYLCWVCCFWVCFLFWCCIWWFSVSCLIDYGTEMLLICVCVCLLCCRLRGWLDLCCVRLLHCFDLIAYCLLFWCVLGLVGFEVDFAGFYARMLGFSWCCIFLCCGLIVFCFRLNVWF